MTASLYVILIFRLYLSHVAPYAVLTAYLLTLLMVMTAMTARESGGSGERERTPDIRLVHPGNAILRRAVQENVVSFPSQIPVLSKQARADMQCHVVMLYFIHGWTMSEIGGRYSLPDFRVSQLLHEWAVRAFALGYVQVIDEDRFAELSQPLSARTNGKMLEAHVSPARPGEHAHPALPPVSEAIPAITALARESVLDTLDRAIDSCASRGGEFWFHSAAALRSLRAAVEVAERSDVSRVAEKLNLAAPALAASAGVGSRGLQGVV
jgi:hypothetical protein